MAKDKGGRPTVMTEEVLAKLEQAFSLGASDREATFYAGISMDSLYEHQVRNPGYSERKAALKDKPLLLARESVVRGMKADSNLALKYLKSKRAEEFSEKHVVESSGVLTHQLVELSDEQYERLVREAAERLAGSPGS